jgi:hypothetical protein
VQLTLWAELGRLTCLVEDHGPGGLNPMTGLRVPRDLSTLGLWVARQQVDDVFIGMSDSGGCRVLLTAT